MDSSCLNFTFYEFFAGGGMVRQALGDSWKCEFANDFDGKKALAYQDNWGTNGELFVGDIKAVKANHLSKPAQLAWASFPCQDLSLAGNGKGLAGKRSGHYFDFWEKIKLNKKHNGMPELVVVENVCGTLTSNSGNDFASLISSFVGNGYFVGGLIFDASHFVPQSRKRLFLLGVRSDLSVDPTFVSPEPFGEFHSNGLVRAFENLEEVAKENWLWFNVSAPPHRKSVLGDLLENDDLVEWNSLNTTSALLESMTTINLKKVEAAKRNPERTVGAVFKRTRPTKHGRAVRAEVRFDGLAGCLRTPNGGSSRQTILVIDGSNVRSRLLSPRETARLMGLPDHYRLPANKNAALHLTGDGVAVPVVVHLKDHLFEPILNQNSCQHTANPELKEVVGF